MRPVFVERTPCLADGAADMHEVLRLWLDFALSAKSNLAQDNK